MGKIRTRILGLEEIEQKQKKEQKEKAAEKKKIRAPGLKGGERMVAVEVDEKELEKMEKAKKIVEEAEKKAQQKPKEIKKKTRGKNYQKAKAQIDKNKLYSIKEAIFLLKKIKYAKFDESFELHLNVDKVGLKGEVELPYSLGKKVKVAIVDDKILTQIEEGKIDFDVLIAHPSFMPKLIKYARILGPKGLMPNPKNGTVSQNPQEAAKKFQKGLLHWKTESKFPLIHQMIGKISQKDEELEENIKAFLKAVGLSHIKEAYLKTTMSPSVKIEVKG
jgi:large subunit ribosomal protein L1